MKKEMIILIVLWEILIQQTPCVYGWAFPLSMEVTQIQFRYGTGATAVTLKKVSGNNVVTIAAPEWEYDPEESQLINNEKFAYIKGDTSASIRAEFYTATYDSTAPLTIQAYPVMGELGWRLSGNVTFSSSGQGYSGTESFSTESGYSTPTTVGTKWINFLWRIQAVNGVPLTTPYNIANSQHFFYSLFASPTSFNDGASSGQPWTFILDSACSWASGQTTVSGCMSSLTAGLNGYSKLRYRLDSHWSNQNSIRLLNLYNDLNAYTISECNCEDYSNILCMFAYSIGLSSTNCQVAQLLPSFDTNLIWPAQQSTPSIFGWPMHQVVYFQSTYIADAAAKVYSGGNYILSLGDKTWLEYKSLLTQDDISIQWSRTSSGTY